MKKQTKQKLLKLEKKIEKEEAKFKLKYYHYLFIFLAILVTILIFTGLDYLVHSLSSEYSVPDYYFKNKIIYGTLIGFIAYLFLRKKKLLAKSLIFSAIIAILLQIRYFIEGYSLDFVFSFLVYHFVMIFVSSLLIFYIIKKTKMEVI